MTHPEERLVDYVDGTVSPVDRAEVERHLSSCDRCSGEVVLARGGKNALRALAQVTAPAGIGDAALSEAGAALARPSSPTSSPRWQRWGAVAAAAAAAALILTLVLPRITGSSTNDERAGQPVPAEGGPSVASAPARLQITRTDYDSDSLTQLATDYAASHGSGGGTTASPATSPTFASAAQTRTAVDCIATAYPELSHPVRLLQASFDHRPAYLGFFERSLARGGETDAILIAVVSSHACTPLSLTQARFSS